MLCTGFWQQAAVKYSLRCYLVIPSVGYDAQVYVAAPLPLLPWLKGLQLRHGFCLGCLS